MVREIGSLKTGPAIGCKFKMHTALRKPTKQTMLVLSLLLLASYVFFLWMFLSAESITQVAAHGQVSGLEGEDDVYMLAARFAARWKHGMAGNSPLYMPGFFAVAILIWLWSLGRPVWKAAMQGVTLMMVALPIAGFFAPEGSVRVVKSFEQFTGLSCSGPLPDFSLAGIAVALYTLLTWSAGIYCIQLSIAKRSVKPLGVPVFMNIVLLYLRPWAINDYVTQWVVDIQRGLPVAIYSFALIPIVLLLLTFYQLKMERIPGRTP